MKHGQINTATRKPVNLSLNTEVVAAAREAGINLSRVSEAALRKATQVEQDRRWKEENREWIDAHRAWVAANELPLERYRLF
jgi:antitoxin CcdA